MSRSAAVAAVAAVSMLTLPTAARAAGGPPVGGWTIAGVAAGKVRYVALPVRGGTLLGRVAVNGGQPLSYRNLRRELGIPMVALDGGGGGLSHDGLTLVMTPQRAGYPQRSSELDLMNARTLTLRRVLRLKGDFSFDAISPDGSTIYLVQLDPRDPTRYAVRALDAASGRLVPKPIVDPREPGEPMRGYPLTRATSPDGRFAYTLYGGGDEKFVHALDTTGRTAACIDVPAFPDSAQMSLRLRGRRLTVLADGAPVSYIDTVTRHVTKAAPAGPPPTGLSQPAGDGGGSVPLWALLAGAAAAALGAAVAVGARRRRAGAARS